MVLSLCVSDLITLNPPNTNLELQSRAACGTWRLARTGIGGILRAGLFAAGHLCV